MWVGGSDQHWESSRENLSGQAGWSDVHVSAGQEESTASSHKLSTSSATEEGCSLSFFFSLFSLSLKIMQAARGGCTGGGCEDRSWRNQDRPQFSG